MFKKEKGGVALEYILVTTFAAIATSIALGVLGKIAKNKMEPLTKKYNIEQDFHDLDTIISE